MLQNTPFEPMKLINLAEDPAEAKPMPATGKVANELMRTLMNHIQKSGRISWQKPVD